MRRAKGPPSGADVIDGKAANRMDEHGLEHLRLAQGRQNRRHALREHRLARAGRTAHEGAVSAAGGDHEGALSRLLVNNVGKVEVSRGSAGRLGAYGPDTRERCHSALEPRDVVDGEGLTKGAGATGAAHEPCGAREREPKVACEQGVGDGPAHLAHRTS